jgi:glycosyltransferase involved in cell wall biosynthesis
MAWNIYVNGRYAGRSITGVERYAHEVVSRIGHRIRLISPRRPLRGIIGHLWEQAYLPMSLDEKDVLWSPTNTGPLLHKNQVATVHDLSPLEHPEWFRTDFAAWYAFFLPRLLWVSKKVITDSEFTKFRMVELLRLPEDKITIAPGGVNQEYFYPVQNGKTAEVLHKHGIKTPYLAFMNPYNPRKNYSTLLKAWNVIKIRNPDLCLVVIGGGG